MGLPDPVPMRVSPLRAVLGRSQVVSCAKSGEGVGSFLVDVARGVVAQRLLRVQR